MIVYSGKQFWNNFNNGDDAVFGDSNRPRDENGFKLRPWLQGDKWSFRDVNKKTNFSDININGVILRQLLYELMLKWKYQP